MKKINLIFAIVFMLCLNSRAQSLNIAENLLDVNSSTFESDMGSWTCNDNNACSRANTDGKNGYYLKLTHTGTGNVNEHDYDKQMEYSLKDKNHAPADNTRYVIKFRAIRNGSDGSGKIKVLLQKNNKDEDYPQIAFGGNSISIADDKWTDYEYDLTTNRGDYEVIKINFGNCGEICIDDIEYGVYTANVAPTFKTNLETSYTVGQGGTLTLSVEASGTPLPTYQWYRNTTNSNENGTLILGETSATYSVPTETKGTYYYYCVAKNVAGSATSNVATVNVTDPIQVTGISLTAPNTMNVGTNAQCTVTISPDNATNKNVTWESSDDTVLSVDQNGNLTAKSTGTATITVRSVDGGGVIPVSKEITVLASNSANGTYVENGMFYMLQDFGNAAVNDTWTIINQESYEVREPGSAKIVADPKYGNVLDFKSGNNVTTEYLVFHCKLPEGKKLSDFSSFVFDYKAISNDRNYKDMKFYWSGIDWSGKTYPTFQTGEESQSPWHTGKIILTDAIKTDENEFDLYIGGIPTYLFEVLITNIRLATDGSYTQNDLTNTWSKVESETLYVTGSGPMPDFNGNQPWRDKNGSITKVIVSENITEIGNNAFRDLSQTVTIILHSIPDRFGSECFKSNSANNNTRILQLELRDSEKPYISKTKASNFPTFNKTTYFRNVTSNYSTVCLPFPISAAEVSSKGAKLYDFTSMGKATVGGEDQYTLEFNGHTGGMDAGQPYLIGTGDMELSNTNVEPSAFNLTPTQVTKSITDTEVSITMVGVFQPVVIATGYAYGFINGSFYMNGGNMSVRPMRASFNGSQLYSAPAYGEQQSSAKPLPSMMRFNIAKDHVTGIDGNVADGGDEGFCIKEVYNLNGVKTNSLTKGVNIIRTSTGKVMKVVVK